MELRHLRYFVTLATELNFTRAAERLLVAQPSLSRQIQDLEREVGARLIERGGAKTALTAAGRVFLEGAEATLASAAETIRRARNQANTALTTLRVGYLHPHFDRLILRVIEAFRQTHPLVAVVPMEMNPVRQADAIERDEIDIGLSGLRHIAETRGLMHEPFTAPMPFMAALPKGHRLTKRRTMVLADYEGEYLIPISDATFPGATSIVTRVFREAGVKVRMRTGAETTTSIFGQVAAGLGLSIVPELLRHSAPAGVVFRPLDDGPVVQFEAIWKAERLTPTITQFLAALRHEGRHLKGEPATVFPKAKRPRKRN